MALQMPVALADLEAILAEHDARLTALEPQAPIVDTPAIPDPAPVDPVSDQATAE